MKPKHVHQYRRTKVGTNGHQVMACTLPGCYHYLPMRLAVGKTSRCYRCGGEFVLTSYIVSRLMKPHCNQCFKGHEDARDVLRDLATLRLRRRATSEHAH